MNINIEVSDADGHEPMGIGTRKYTMRLPENIGMHAIARRVKNEIGWRGRRTTLVVDGRAIKIYSSDPLQICTILIEDGGIGFLKEISGAS
jgi:hypothetical protein